MRVPGHLRPVVDRMRTDFDQVTGYWLERGYARPDDVVHMRAVIAEQIGSVDAPTPNIDPRSHEKRVLAWADTWRALASECPWPIGLAHPGGVLLRDMIVEVRRGTD